MTASRTPRQRWGTCCPWDPECEHSFLDDVDLAHWLDTPLVDDVAALLAAGSPTEERRR